MENQYFRIVEGIKNDGEPRQFLEISNKGDPISAAVTILAKQNGVSKLEVKYEEQMTNVEHAACLDDQGNFDERRFLALTAGMQFGWRAHIHYTLQEKPSEN